MRFASWRLEYGGFAGKAQVRRTSGLGAVQPQDRELHIYGFILRLSLPVKPRVFCFFLANPLDVCKIVVTYVRGTIRHI
jgi:hypothetical protein